LNRDVKIVKKEQKKPKTSICQLRTNSNVIKFEKYIHKSKILHQYHLYVQMSHNVYNIDYILILELFFFITK